MMATSHQRPPRGSMADGRALHRATILKRSLSVQLQRLSLLFDDLILSFMDCSGSGRRCDSRTRCPVSQVSCSLPSAQRFHPPPVRAAPVDGREGNWCAAFVLLRCPAFLIASGPLRTHGVAGTDLFHRVRRSAVSVLSMRHAQSLRHALHAHAAVSRVVEHAEALPGSNVIAIRDLRLVRPTLIGCTTAARVAGWSRLPSEWRPSPSMHVCASSTMTTSRNLPSITIERCM